MWFLKFPKSLKDLLITGFVSVCLLVSLVIVTRLLAVGLGPDKFGEYSLARTIIKTITTFTTLGMTVAIPRYLAFYEGQQKKQNAYILYGCGLVLFFTIIIIFFSLLLPETVGFLFFHKTQSDYLLYGTMILLLGHTIHMLNYGIYRGKLLMNYANLFQLLVIGLIPILCAVYFGKTEAWLVLTTMGLGSILLISVPFSFNFIKSFDSLKYNHFRFKEAKEIIKYGLPRVPADIGLGLMFFAGPWLSAKFGNIKEAGYFVIGQSALNVINTLLETIGLVTLPHFAKLSGERKYDVLQEQVSMVVNFAIHFGIFATVQLLIFADWITILWCGKEYASAIPIIRIILASSGGYAIYVSLRSIIDAHEVSAINTKNIWFSLCFGLSAAFLIYILNPEVLAYAIGLALSIGLLGSLSLIFIHKRFGLKIKSYNIEIIIIFNIVTGITALGIKNVLPLNFESSIYIALFEIFSILIYFITLRKIRASWLIKILEHINKRSI